MDVTLRAFKVSTRSRRGGSIALVLGLISMLAACGTPAQEAPLPSAPPRASVAAAPAASSAAADPAASAAPVALPPPGEPAIGAAGPAYVLVEHVGVLRIEGGKVTTAVELPKDASVWRASLVATPAGDLWLSDWRGISVLGAAGGAPKTIPLGKAHPLYENLIVRSPSDVWAVTTDTEWAVLHFDGKRWSEVRKRAQFPGTFDDNKFGAMAVTSEGVWVSSWNGLWRGAGKDWQKITAPVERETAPNLYVYKDKIVAGYLDQFFLRDGASWKKLPWAEPKVLIRAVSDLGFSVTPSPDRHRVVIEAIDGKTPAVLSDPVQGSWIRDLTIDGAGRTWVVTDYALAVIDRAGHRVVEWTPGTLEGLVGKVERVAVVGAGPADLPQPTAARSWEVVGHMQTYKSRAPLAGAALELCPSPEETRGCAGAPLVRTATTKADGSFRFVDVPEGDLRIVVKPPANLSDCEGIFNVRGHSFSPGRECKAAPGAPRVCDLGTLTQCLPFEMPPPR